MWQAFKLAQQSLEHYVKNQHTEWFNSIDPSLTKKLDYNLILIEEDKNGLLKCNFDKSLLSCFNEVPAPPATHPIHLRHPSLVPPSFTQNRKSLGTVLLSFLQTKSGFYAACRYV